MIGEQIEVESNPLKQLYHFFFMPIHVFVVVLPMMIPSQPLYQNSESFLLSVDSTCHWSKTTCIPGKICDNAKYVCPPVRLNEVSPHSCGVSSYDLDQNEVLSKCSVKSIYQ